MAAGGDVVDIARRYRLSRTSVAKHVEQQHPEAAPPASDAPREPAPVLSLVPPRAPTPSEPSPADAGARAPLTRTSARALIDDLIQCASRYISDAETDELASYRDKTGLLVAAHGLSKTLGKLTAELDVTDADIVASPKWRALRSAIVEAVRPYPEAVEALIGAIDRVEGAA